jgi:RNA-dependent RNA polymerase
MAQAFSSTDPTIVLTPGELRTIPDIKRNESLFTDGVGTMSEEVADAIWDALRKIPGGKHRELSRASPSAYQIRIGGHKGWSYRSYDVDIHTNLGSCHRNA